MTEGFLATETGQVGDRSGALSYLLAIELTKHSGRNWSAFGRRCLGDTDRMKLAGNLLVQSGKMIG